MAYNYNKYKNAYLWLTDDQRKQWDTKYWETAEYKQFKSDYSNEQNNVYTPSTTQQATTWNYIYWDTWWASSSSKYTWTGVSGGGNFQYNSSINTEKLWDINMLFWSSAEQYESQNPWYLEKRNNAIANALYNEWKTDRASVENYLNNFSGYTSYDKAWQQNTVDAIMNRIWSNTGQNNGNNTNSLNAGMMNDMGTNYNNYKNGYSNLMWGSSNYASNFDEAVLNKLRTAYWIESLDEFKQRYPEQYNSLMQSLETIRPVRDATNPSQRQMLDWQLQWIIGTWVGAWSDWSKLNVLESSILNKFENPEQIKQDAKNIIKLQTEWKSIGEIASEMWMSEDQVQQLVLLANWLDSKAWEYYKLTDKASKDITEPYDKKLDRAEIEKNIALERANRQVEWLKEDFDTNMERQKKANEVNLHNADFLSWQYGYWFSKRGIEWLQYTSQQAQNLIDDLCKNYDRNNQQLADWIADIIRNWERYNEDITEASEEALTQAKNNYTSNMLAIQQQYGTVWLQAQQQLSNNVQSFITTAENIYDNMLQQQQQNLTNLITNASNLNALSMQNLTLRQAKIEQFQSESMNLNRSQLQNLADQLWMDKETYQDLVNYQVQAVANQLNGYVPWAWMQFQSQIQSLLDSWYTPNQALGSIINSADFQAIQSTWWGNGEWKISGDYMYNTATWDWQNLTWGWDAGNYVSYETIWGQTYWVSQKTYNWLASFMSKYQKWDTWGQCGEFVNKYLKSLWQSGIFGSLLKDKTKNINTPDWYSPQIWDVVIMDSPYAETKKYGHVAIITGVNDDGSFTTLESNQKNNDRKVFSRTIDPSKTKVYWYYHPDGVGTNESNTQDDKSYRTAQSILNGVGTLPAKNSKEYTDVVNALDDLVKQKWWNGYPKWKELINYSVIFDSQLWANEQQAISSTAGSIYSTDMLMDLLKENNYKTWPIMSKLRWWNPRDADYSAINASINAMASNIARWFGEKWVLSDKDIERYMKTLPNTKMWDNAQEVVGTLLKAKLYSWLVNTLETAAKNKRDVSMYIENYNEAVNWLTKNWFMQSTSSWRWGLSGGWSMSWAGWRW